MRGGGCWGRPAESRFADTEIHERFKISGGEAVEGGGGERDKSGECIHRDKWDSEKCILTNQA